MERKTIEENKNGARDYAVLVGLKSPVLGADSADEESLAELAALVETAGGQSVGMILQSREKPDPHSFIGEGKVEEVKRMVENSEATMVIFDNDLSPSQVRVLTELCGVQVLDRSGLILDIFAQRARTKEGCLQVELAQYQYLLPRLIGMWSHLERQGGTGGSPIGTKGPGETQLETDRRHIRRKIDKLREDLEEVVSDVFLALWAHAEALDPTHVRAWLGTVARMPARRTPAPRSSSTTTALPNLPPWRNHRSTGRTPASPLPRSMLQYCSITPKRMGARMSRTTTLNTTKRISWA